MAAAQLVKVWNDNEFPHVEKFKGKVIEIPAKEWIEMDHDEAVQFAGQFKAPIVTGQGTHDPRGFKKIRVEKPKAKLHIHNPLTNPLTGQTFQSEAELKADLERFKHLAAPTDKDAEALAAQRHSEVEALKAENAELGAKVDKLTAAVEQLLAQKGDNHAGKPRIKR